MMNRLICTPPTKKPYALIVLAMAVVVVLLSYRMMFAGLSADACSYAQLSRNIQQHRGYQTSSLPPVAFSIWQSTKHTPELSHPPAYPVFQSLMFRLFQPWDRTALMSSAVWYMVLIIIMVCFAAKTVDRGVGITAAVVLILWPTFSQRFALSAMPYSMAAAWWCIAWLIYYDALNKQEASDDYQMPLSHQLAAGVCMAMCVLTQSSLWIGCLIISSVCILQQRVRLHLVHASTIVFLAAIIAWFVYRACALHIPVLPLNMAELMMDTPMYPDSTFYNMIATGSIPPWWPSTSSELMAVMAKWMRNTLSFCMNNGAVMFMLPWAVIGVYLSPTTKQLRYGVVSLCIVFLTVVVYAFGRESGASNAVFPYIPMLLIMSINGLRLLCEVYDDSGIHFKRACIVLSVFCVVCFAGYAANNASTESPLRVQTYHIGEAIAKHEQMKLINSACLKDTDILDASGVLNAMTSPSNPLEHALAARISTRDIAMLKFIDNAEQKRHIAAIILNDAIKGGTELTDVAAQVNVHIISAEYHCQDSMGQGAETPWHNRRIIEAYWPKAIKSKPIPPIHRSIGICDQPDIAAWYTNTAWIAIPESPLVDVAHHITSNDEPVFTRQADDTSLKQLEKQSPQYLMLSPDVVTPRSAKLIGWYYVYQQARTYLSLRESMSPNDRAKLDRSIANNKQSLVYPQALFPCPSAGREAQPRVYSDIVLCFIRYKSQDGR